MTEIQANLNRLLARLAASGRRITPQRVAVCETLLAHGGHPTIAELWRRVRATHPTISQATVYNTIAALEELRLIQKLELAGDEHAHYDTHVEPHVNVVCTRCGQIADVYTDTLEALLGLVASRSGYQLASGSAVTVYGLCAACQQQVAAAAAPAR
jgi:Fur family peroxide stress response transcriptional regulator